MAQNMNKVQSGWKDNIQPFSAARGTGVTEPNWQDTGNGIFAYCFTAGEALFVTYHVTHDYKRGSKAYPHIHFFVDATMTAGQQITWRFEYVIAIGHSQGGSLTATPVQFDLVYTATGNEVAGEHIILECSDAQAFELIEPDSIVKAKVSLVSENVAGNIYGELCDLHYEIEGLATPNKEPDFYNSFP